MRVKGAFTSHINFNYLMCELNEMWLARTLMPVGEKKREVLQFIKVPVGALVNICLVSSCAFNFSSPWMIFEFCRLSKDL